MKHLKISIIAVFFLFFIFLFFAEQKIFLKQKNKTPKIIPRQIDTLPSKIFTDIKPPKKNEIVDYASTKQKVIALTFDADMTMTMEYSLKNKKVRSWYNEKVITELEKNQTPATLFLTGLWIKNYPEITDKLSKNPLFEIANHSYSHSAFASPCYKLSVIPDSLDEKEIKQTEKMLEQYAPNYKKYFRFPGLCYDKIDLFKIQKLGYKIIGGNISGLDGFTHDTNGIINRIISRLTPGGIIILHMHGGHNAPQTAEALPEIIKQTKDKGYKFVKISELLNIKD